MRKINIFSISIAGLFLLPSAPALAQMANINDLIPQATLAKFCADKAVGSEHKVQFTTDNGVTIKGEIKCGVNEAKDTHKNGDKSNDDATGSSKNHKNKNNHSSDDDMSKDDNDHSNDKDQGNSNMRSDDSRDMESDDSDHLSDDSNDHDNADMGSRDDDHKGKNHDD